MPLGEALAVPAQRTSEHRGVVAALEGIADVGEEEVGVDVGVAAQVGGEGGVDDA